MEQPPFRRRLQLWRNRMRLLTGIRRRGRSFQFLLPAAIKPMVRTARYVIPIVALIPSLIVFRSVWISFLIAFGFYVAGLLVERVAFVYVSMAMAPTPDYIEEPEKWLGVFFGFSEAFGKRMPCVGMFFSDSEYAHKVHSLVLQWNCGEQTERAHNIDIEVVWLSEARYAFFCHPSPDHPFYKQMRAAAENKLPPDGLHVPLFGTIIMGKVCDITEASFLPQFCQQYTPGTPFLFECAVYTGGNDAQRAAGCDPLVLRHLRICRKDDLTDQDLIHGFVKYGPFGK